MWSFRLFSGLFLLLQPCLADNDVDDDAPGLDHGIFEWINASDNGYYNPKQEFRADATGFIGVFANAPISKGEILCSVPWEMKVAADDDCGTADLLAEAMRTPEDSEFEPYASYLRNQPFHQLPGWWSEEGKEYLERLLDGVMEPTGVTGFYQESWHDECEDGSETEEDDEWWSHAAMQVQARADDDVLIPAYDMYNHRNGHWNNAETHWAVIIDEEDEEEEEYKESPHVTTANRDIDEGEQIYISYNMCPGCGGRSTNGYGTPQMFRDYGFVENFPQRWTFMTLEPKYRTGKMEFDLDKDPEGKLALNWRKQPTSNRRAVEWLEQQKGRLEKFRLSDAFSPRVPPAELEVIALFREANIVAMSEALRFLSAGADPVVEDDVRADADPVVEDDVKDDEEQQNQQPQQEQRVNRNEQYDYDYYDNDDDEEEDMDDDEIEDDGYYYEDEEEEEHDVRADADPVVEDDVRADTGAEDEL